MHPKICNDPSNGIKESNMKGSLGTRAQQMTYTFHALFPDLFPLSTTGCVDCCGLANSCIVVVNIVTVDLIQSQDCHESVCQNKPKKVHDILQAVWVSYLEKIRWKIKSWKNMILYKTLLSMILHRLCGADDYIQYALKALVALSVLRTPITIGLLLHSWNERF